MPKASPLRYPLGTGPHRSADELACRPLHGGLLVVIAVAACALTALAFGPDANWDLRNYHLYVAWAWLDARHATDIAAAQAQTWNNPLLWIPHFLLFERTDGALLAALLGAVHGLCAWPLLRIAQALLPQATGRVQAFVVAAGLGCATFLGQLGASYGDNLLALLALAGIATLLQHPGDAGRGLVAGACFGAVAALKLSHAPIALGLCVAAPLACVGARARCRLSVAVAVGAVASFGMLGGPWILHLWQQWGNPLFPQFDRQFAAGWIAPATTRDLRFMPTSLGQALLRPFSALIDWQATSDYRIRDARPLLLWIALLTCAIRWRRIAQPLRMLALACAVGWFGWLLLFGYHRYLIVTDMLAGALLVASVAPAWNRWALLAVTLAMLATNPPDHERATRHWTAGQPLASPAAELSPDTMLVIAGDAPIAHLLPFLPRFASAVRIEGNFYGPDQPALRLQRLIGARIAAHPGPLALLVQAPQPDVADRALAGHALRREAAPCETLDDALQQAGAPPIWLCRLLHGPD